MTRPPGEIAVPPRLRASLDGTHHVWLEQLPHLIGRASTRWRLVVGQPYVPGGASAWVAPVSLALGESPAVLKLGHSRQAISEEAQALRLCNGDGMVRLIDHDDELGALLIERCRRDATAETMSSKRAIQVATTLLSQVWMHGASGAQVDSLAGRAPTMLEGIGREPALSGVRGAAVAGWEYLVSSSAVDLLHGDCHPRNILMMGGGQWRLIDPKPFLGDRTYDLAQVLLHFGDPLDGALRSRVRSVAASTGVDMEVLRCVVAARCAEWALWCRARGLDGSARWNIAAIESVMC
jgi:streptomycin 6-kinase